MTKSSPLTIYVITMYPQAFPGVLGVGVIGNALKTQKFELNIVNLYDFALGKHHMIDDTPFGGGAGMIMRADVIGPALDYIIELCNKEDFLIIFPTPKTDNIFQQEWVKTLAKSSVLIFLCGRFEGIDERILQAYPVLSLSLGDFVLSGGEVAAQTMIESIIRTKHKVLGNSNSLINESFENCLLEHPQYTKPQVWQNLPVPEVLLSGHHAKIKEWKLKQSELITQRMRPDLWQKYLEKNLK